MVHPASKVAIKGAAPTPKPTRKRGQAIAGSALS